MFTSSFYSRGRHRAALVLCGGLLALTLPALFLAAPAHAQSNADQTAITQLLRSVINLQTQVMQSGNRDLLNQSQALLQQVRELMTAIETGGPLPTPGSASDDEGDNTASTDDTSTTVETPENDDTTAAETDGTGTIPGAPVTTVAGDVTICPELSITQRELSDYVRGAYQLEGQRQISGYNPDIPPGIECLGEAIMRQCDTAIAHHEEGYTFYVTQGESAYNDPVFGTQRCYIGLSVTDEPENATVCNLESIANRPRDASSFYSWNELEWYLKVTLPEFMADHAFPLDGSYNTFVTGGGDRDRGSYYFGTDPVARLASQMACTAQAIDLPDQTME